MDDSGILDEERPDRLSLGIELRISDRKSSALTGFSLTRGGEQHENTTGSI